MAAKTKTRKHPRLTSEMLATASEMHALGIMDDAGYAKITMRRVDKADAQRRCPKRSLFGDAL